MSVLDQFRKSLETTCRIASWTPSNLELREIARRISAAQPSSLDKAVSIVIAVCPDTLFIILEGVDNSDLRTLLALATAATQG